LSYLERLILDLEYGLDHERRDWDKVAVTAVVSQDSILQLPIEAGWDRLEAHTDLKALRRKWYLIVRSEHLTI
jgi:hypothetical protein